MKARSPLITVGVAFIGILIVSVGMIILGSKESRAFPSADSYLPSGTSAFAELLRRNHYQVVVDHHPKPALRPGDTVIAFDPSITQAMSAVTAEGGGEDLAATKEVIDQFVRDGGNVISFSMSPDFSEESKRLWNTTRNVLSSDGAKAQVTCDETGSVNYYLDDSANDSTDALWSLSSRGGARSSASPFVAISSNGKGFEATFSQGIIATNRFIDRNENAYVLADVVARLAKPNGRIVFAEAAFGNSATPGLLATIGPWAVAGWMQLLFLAIVVFYTLGKPFGLPDPERRQERGARDLMDAMADTLRRGRMTKLALKTVYDDTTRQLRRMARGRPLERTGMTLDHMTDLERAVNKLEAAAEIGAPESMAVKLIEDVERLTKESGNRSR